MQNFFSRLDSLAGIETANKTAVWSERAAFIFMTLMVLFAPHSIAATETAWLIGMLFWAIRLFVKPRPRFVKTPLNIALWAFVGWTILTCFFSYAPDISFDRLRSVSVFLVFFFIINNLRSKRAAVFLAFALVFSCMVNVVWTPLERVIGRGVQVSGVKPESPLTKAGIINGDTILKVNGKKVSTPDDITNEIEGGDISDIYFFRPDSYPTVKIYKTDLLYGADSFEKLGITNWKRSRNWRSQGFFGHWVTYSEVLQLIASLVFGILAALFLSRKNNSQTNHDSRITKYILLFGVCLGGMLFALLLTTTRASQAGFVASAFAIVWLTGRRKWLLILAAIVLPLIIGGLIYLQQTRNVGFYDTSDGSITWRQTVYREGFNLWTASPRNFMLGVGMDSIKRYAKDWHLFDDGRLPMGHFHSTPLQLLVERGLPSLLLWFWVLWLYARTLYKVHSSRFKAQSSELSDWKVNGVLLGSFGGLVGFFTSGIVHNNLGDTQVATVFYILMGIGVSLIMNYK